MHIVVYISAVLFNKFSALPCDAVYQRLSPGLQSNTVVIRPTVLVAFLLHWQCALAILCLA